MITKEEIMGTTILLFCCLAFVSRLIRTTNGVINALGKHLNFKFQEENLCLTLQIAQIMMLC